MDFLNVTIIDIIDILLVTFIFWQVYRLVRGTVATTIFVVIFLIYVLWAVVQALNMELMSAILSQILGVGVIALIVVFQQEIRQSLLLIGNRLRNTSNKFLRHFVGNKTLTVSSNAISEIVNGVMNMASNKIGALIVFERKSTLENITETGDLINADISSRLIETIFFKNTPLHDGAMIIADNRIKYARCVLPVSENLSINPSLGLRHRAAAGVTERTDAFAIVVSEQTGKVSVIDKGQIRTLSAGDNLTEIITENLTL